MDKLVMTDDVIAAAHLWQEVDTSPDRQKHFEQFLGVTVKALADTRAWTVLLSPEGCDRLALLLGPNAHTIIKIYLAKLS